MNRLLILLVLQLGMSGAILYVLMDGDNKPQLQASERPPIGREEIVQEVRSVPSAASVDAESIRQIVRSELSEFAAQFPGPATGREVDASDIDPLERDTQLVQARDRLALYLSAGEITDRDIDELYIDIAPLDLASQKAILGDFFGEVNAGNVKIRP